MGVIPHATDSWRAVRVEGVAARMGAVGRNREIARAVSPLFVQAMMAAHSASMAARQPAADTAAVIRSWPVVPSGSVVCWRPTSRPQRP